TGRGGYAATCGLNKVGQRRLQTFTEPKGSHLPGWFLASNRAGSRKTPPSGCRGRKEKAPPDDGAKDVMHGATQGSLNPSPTRSHSRANTSKLGQGITLSAWLALCRSRSCPAPARLPSALTAGRGA